MGEQITNIFEALSLLHSLEQESDNGDSQFKKKEMQAYIDTILSYYQDLPVEIKIIKASDDPSKESIIEVVFEDAVHFYEAVTLYIGKSGFFVKGNPHFPMNSLLKIKVILKKEQIDFTVSGKVVWLIPRGKKGKPAGIGIKLYKLDNLKKGLLEDFKKGLIPPELLSTLSEE